MSTLPNPNTVIRENTSASYTEGDNNSRPDAINKTNPIVVHQVVHQEDVLPLSDINALPQPYPAPILSATFKSSPADFKVDEIMDVNPSGEGEHLWLQIQKSGMNTVYVAEQLAKWANIPKRDVGFSGMKDRQAVTTQWFSVRLPKKQAPAMAFDDFMMIAQHTQATHHTAETLSVLSQSWHSKKLNRGTHRGNRFLITLHNVLFNAAVAANPVAATQVLQDIAKQGVPNYFGSQRFGHNGNNLTQALEWFEHGLINGRKPHPKKSRDLQSLLLSAARSAIFNQILARRVSDGSWNKGLAGEVFNLAGSSSVFSSEQLDAALIARVQSGDIHPTGPLWGTHNDKVTGLARLIEEETVQNQPILQALASGLHNKGVKTMRRALRLPISDFEQQWRPNDSLVLSFTLPSGAFATCFLASCIQKMTS